MWQRIEEVIQRAGDYLYNFLLYLLATFISGFKPALLHKEAVQSLAFMASVSVSVAKQ